jgi:hypothetical protein
MVSTRRIGFKNDAAPGVVVPWAVDSGVVRPGVVGLGVVVPWAASGVVVGSGVVALDIVWFGSDTTPQPTRYHHTLSK